MAFDIVLLLEEPTDRDIQTLDERLETMAGLVQVYKKVINYGLSNELQSINYS